MTCNKNDLIRLTNEGRDDHIMVLVKNEERGGGEGRRQLNDVLLCTLVLCVCEGGEISIQGGE